jgi:hypothetical protein
VGTLQVNSPNQLIFGVPVTIALRNALQNAQAATGALPASCAASASDTVACTPSLSSSTIAGVYTGRLLTAAKIGVAGDATPLYLIRRGTTSGTQKTAEVVFLNADITPPAQTTNLFKAPTGTYNSVAASLGYVKEDPLAAIPVTGAPGACGDASTGFSVVTPTVSLVPPATTVFAGNANEEIVNCLNRHQSGGRYAIGINTTEFNQFANPSSGSTAIDSNFTTGFRFIKVDGYLPTVANVIRGNYQFFSEQVITNLPTIAGAALQVKSAIVAELGNAINVTTVNSTFTKWTDAPAGEQTSGLVKPAVSTACAGLYSATSTTPDTDPVNYTTKNPTGTKANNAIKPSLAVCTPRY